MPKERGSRLAEKVEQAYEENKGLNRRDLEDGAWGDVQMNIRIRVYLGDKIHSDKAYYGYPDEKLDELLPELAKEHAELLAENAGMVEIEFLDEPDPNQRYFRIGTDPNGMRQPRRVDSPEEVMDLVKKIFK